MRFIHVECVSASLDAGHTVLNRHSFCSQRTLLVRLYKEELPFAAQKMSSLIGRAQAW